MCPQRYKIRTFLLVLSCFPSSHTPSSLCLRGKVGRASWSQIILPRCHFQVFHSVADGVFVMNVLAYDHCPPSMSTSASSHPPFRGYLFAWYVFKYLLRWSLGHLSEWCCSWLAVGMIFAIFLNSESYKHGPHSFHALHVQPWIFFFYQFMKAQLLPLSRWALLWADWSWRGPSFQEGDTITLRILGGHSVSFQEGLWEQEVSR